MSKLVPLADAFRMVLRAESTERPKFADEINPLYFQFPASMGATESEMTTAKAVKEKLRLAILQQHVRLHGCIEGGSAADVNVIEIQQNGIYWFKGEVHYRDGRKCLNVHCYEDEIRALAKKTGKGGRPTKFDRAAVAAEIERLMDHHGEFSADDPDWNAQERLKEALREKFGEAAPSTFDDYIVEPLAKWRAKKAEHPKT
jgi:hypothetical protein